MVLLWRIERPSPRAKASRISGRPAWFSISAGSACESARTKPLEVITVTRAPPADITAVHSRSAVESSDLAGASARDLRERGKLVETGALVVATQHALRKNVHREQHAKQERQIGEAQLPKEVKPHEFQTNSRRRARFSGAQGFRDRPLSSHAIAGHTRPRCAESQSVPFPRRRRAIGRG